MNMMNIGNSLCGICGQLLVYVLLMNVERGQIIRQPIAAALTVRLYAVQEPSIYRRIK